MLASSISEAANHKLDMLLFCFRPFIEMTKRKSLASKSSEFRGTRKSNTYSSSLNLKVEELDKHL